MYRFIKKFFVGCLLFGLMTATASAAETIEAEGNKIGYDYGNNKISITDKSNVGADKQQLTVLLVKGDILDSSQITGEDIYYVDQTEGDSFNVFQNLGVKGGHLEPGKYTMIAGGNKITSDQMFKNTVIIGNVNAESVTAALPGATFYKNHDTAMVPYDGKYAYATISDFDTFNTDNSGWLLQYIGSDGKVYQLVKNVSDLKPVDVPNINATTSVGLQINGITVDKKDFVAIPFTIKAAN